LSLLRGVVAQVFGAFHGLTLLRPYRPIEDLDAALREASARARHGVEFIDAKLTDLLTLKAAARVWRPIADCAPLPEHTEKHTRAKWRGLVVFGAHEPCKLGFVEFRDLTHLAEKVVGKGRSYGPLAKNLERWSKPDATSGGPLIVPYGIVGQSGKERLCGIQIPLLTEGLVWLAQLRLAAGHEKVPTVEIQRAFMEDFARSGLPIEGNKLPTSNVGVRRWLDERRDPHAARNAFLDNEARAKQRQRVVASATTHET
jgi:hypothetical protein